MKTKKNILKYLIICVVVFSIPVCFGAIQKQKSSTKYFDTFYLLSLKDCCESVKRFFKCLWSCGQEARAQATEAEAPAAEDQAQPVDQAPPPPPPAGGAPPPPPPAPPPAPPPPGT